jgi:predicted tellurium resistance membrane protein TerC
MKIALLFGINLLIQMKEPWFSIDLSWFSGITGQSIILFLGGLFLIYKSTSEIREKVDEKGHEEKKLGKAATKSFQNVLQIIMIDLVFSFDSILTVGMTNGVEGALYIIYSGGYFCFIMMQFAVPVSFVNKHSIQILGLAF